MILNLRVLGLEILGLGMEFGELILEEQLPQVQGHLVHTAEVIISTLKLAEVGLQVL